MLRKEQIEYALHYADDPVEWVFELVRGLEKRIDELVKYGTKVTVFQEHWRPASELPVIPEGKNWVKVVALVDYGDNTLRPRHEIYKDKGWSKEDMWTIVWWCYPPEKE